MFEKFVVIFLFFEIAWCNFPPNEVAHRAYALARIKLARVYPANEYEEFENKPDKRSEENYILEYQGEKKDASKKAKTIEFYKCLFAREYVRRKLELDYSSEEQFFKKQVEYYKNLLIKLKEKKLLRWPRVIFDTETDELTILPEVFSDEKIDDDSHSEVDYEKPSRGSDITPSFTGREKLTNLEWENLIESSDFLPIDLDPKIKEIVLDKVRSKMGLSKKNLQKHHVIPHSASTTVMNNFASLLAHLRSMRSMREEDLLRDRLSEIVVLSALGKDVWDKKGDVRDDHVKTYIKKYIKHRLTDNSGNLFHGPNSNNRGDDPQDRFEVNANVLYGTDEEFESVKNLYKKMITIIVKYRLLSDDALKKMHEAEEDEIEKETDEEKKKLLRKELDEVKKKDIVENLIKTKDGEKSFAEIFQIYLEFFEIIRERDAVFLPAIVDHSLMNDDQPIAIYPTMWELKKKNVGDKKEKFFLRTREERDKKRIPNWLKKIIDEVKNKYGVEIPEENNVKDMLTVKAGKMLYYYRERKIRNKLLLNSLFVKDDNLDDVNAKFVINVPIDPICFSSSMVDIANKIVSGNFETVKREYKKLKTFDPHDLKIYLKLTEYVFDELCSKGIDMNPVLFNLLSKEDKIAVKRKFQESQREAESMKKAKIAYKIMNDYYEEIKNEFEKSPKSLEKESIPYKFLLMEYVSDELDKPDSERNPYFSKFFVNEAVGVVDNAIPALSLRGGGEPSSSSPVLKLRLPTSPVLKLRASTMPVLKLRLSTEPTLTTSEASLDIPVSSGIFLCAASSFVSGSSRTKRGVNEDIAIANPIQKILTFNMSDENTVNEKIYDELVHEACGDEKCNLTDYMNRKILDRNYTGVMGRTLERICSTEILERFPFFGKCLDMMNLTGDPVKTLVDEKLLYSYEFESISGYRDDVYATIIDEAKRRYGLSEIHDFDPKKYAYEHADDTTSVVNAMLSNACGVETKPLKLIEKFRIFKDGKVYECDTSEIKNWWDKFWNFIFPKCIVIHDELRR